MEWSISEFWQRTTPKFLSMKGLRNIAIESEARSILGTSCYEGGCEMESDRDIEYEVAEGGWAREVKNLQEEKSFSVSRPNGSNGWKDS
jgi:hypothetical protein